MSIPIPVGMELATVVWRLGHTTQTETLAGARGLVKFEPTATAVSYPDTTVLPTPVTARVQGGVMEPVELTVNDPELWNWRVTPEFGVSWTPFHIDVPAAGVDLATAVVVPGKGPVRAVTGPPGAGIAFHGEKNTVDDLPDDAIAGDGWLIDGDLHVWSGHRWVNAGPIRGPRGFPGDRGPAPVIEWDGTRLVINGQSGPDLEGEPGADSTVPGPPGPANSLTVGSVQTGEIADALITGQAPYQELHLTFPSDTAEGLTDRLAALERDTGTLTVTSMFIEVTNGDVFIRRVGNVVHVTLYDVEFADSTPPEFFYLADLLPTGYRPAVNTSFTAMADVNGTMTRRVRFQADGRVLLYDITPETRINVTASYLTPNAWPAS